MRQLKITKSITNRESASLDKYLQEISKEEMVSAEEEVELAQLIRKGDKKALERLTRANLRFVVSVAKQYQNQGLSLPDLINEGNLGLLKAAERFDETRGFKFISYAVWWIRQSILQAISEQSRIVRLPLNQVGSVNKINREISKFEQENERRPSVHEIADNIDLPHEKIDDAMNISGRHLSVDAPFSDAEDGSLLDVLINEDIPPTDVSLVSESLKSEIQAALSVLNERERNVIEASYGLGMQELTLEEIGEKYGLSRERVRQIKEKAIRKLRASTQNKMTMTTLSASAKNIMVPKAYMFGFVASFNDSIVYFTDIQAVDSVWVQEKKKLLAGRSNYSYQLREFFTNTYNMPNRTCVVISDLNRHKLEKKFLKMKKQYAEKGAKKYEVHYINSSEFRFHSVNMEESNNKPTAVTPKNSKAGKPKKSKKKK